jgi:adenosylcobinamide kinase/adenosylcobinamide-phosphate guanylyltransferase
MSLILVGGGARSGKSRHALHLARQAGQRLAFIATAARSNDDEMRRRIDLHQRERGSEFTTFEEPLAVTSLINIQAAKFDAVVVDCLTLWLSNHMFADPDGLEDSGRALVDAAARARPPVILVTNEVGCGIVPENALAREFRDRAGKLNQQSAERAEAVYWMVFGIAMKVK